MPWICPRGCHWEPERLFAVLQFQYRTSTIVRHFAADDGELVQVLGAGKMRGADRYEYGAARCSACRAVVKWVERDVCKVRDAAESWTDYVARLACGDTIPFVWQSHSHSHAHPDVHSVVVDIDADYLIVRYGRVDGRVACYRAHDDWAELVEAGDMYFLIVRVEANTNLRAVDKTPPVATITRVHRRVDPDQDMVGRELRDVGYELGPLGHIETADWPLTAICYVSASPDGKGRSSNLYRWPCRRKAAGM